MAELKPSKYEPILKEDLVCFRCDQPQKNMPTLKAHLQTEWDNLRKREKALLEKKNGPVKASTTTSSTKAEINERKREREDASDDEKGSGSEAAGSSARARKRREVDTDD